MKFAESFYWGIAMISSDHHMVIVINFSSLEKPEKKKPSLAQYSHLQHIMIVMTPQYHWINFLNFFVHLTSRHLVSRECESNFNIVRGESFIMVSSPVQWNFFSAFASLKSWGDCLFPLLPKTFLKQKLG